MKFGEHLSLPVFDCTLQEKDRSNTKNLLHTDSPFCMSNTNCVRSGIEISIRNFQNFRNFGPPPTGNYLGQIFCIFLNVCKFGQNLLISVKIC